MMAIGKIMLLKDIERGNMSVFHRIFCADNVTNRPLFVEIQNKLHLQVYFVFLQALKWGIIIYG